jgi:DNA (cytosine-5)-methyltransferase 1
MLIESSLVADILSVSKKNLKDWEKNGSLIPYKTDNGKSLYHPDQLEKFPEFKSMNYERWEEESIVNPIKDFYIGELFAGAGGLALGLEHAGFKKIFLNEIDKHACATLRKNRPDWNVLEGDIKNIDFSDYKNKVDILTGGFPCQSFSYAGKRLGFNDIRGTMFFEFARTIQETNPKVILAENVRGLLTHDDGKTIDTILSVLDEIGYTVIEQKVYKAIFYKVPQKRERLIIIAIRKDLVFNTQYKTPSPYSRVMTVKDALKAGDLYETNVPLASGQSYPPRKAEILSYVPEGGYWRDLPDELQREYMQKSYFLGGGKTGMARRLAWNEPSLTLTCSPAQKQTERCHPSENRPLTTREYARIQTFPDNWQFEGPTSAVYKQIGNAVPINLAAAIGRSLVRFLNSIESK